jgi:hypothetical protein
MKSASFGLVAVAASAVAIRVEFKQIRHTPPALARRGKAAVAVANPANALAHVQTLATTTAGTGVPDAVDIRCVALVCAVQARTDRREPHAAPYMTCYISRT